MVSGMRHADRTALRRALLGGIRSLQGGLGNSVDTQSRVHGPGLEDG
jgi:hypothetical protein